MKNSRIAIAILAGFGTSFWACAADQGVAWSVKPRVSMKETLTDNANVNRGTNGNSTEFISELSPGIHIDAQTARLKASLDYALAGQLYARNSGKNRTQNSLNAFGTFEALEQWLFIDFGGYIAQQSISAFGPQSASNSTINNNRTETSNYRISPHIKGQFSGLFDYSLRYSVSTTQSEASSVSDVELSHWSGNIRGATPLRKLNWSMDASQQTTDYSRGRKVDAGLVRGMLTYSVFPDFRVSISGGSESNNYASRETESKATHGYGFDWNPTERSKVSVFREKRFFGNGHNISLSHRFPMSSIQFTDVKDVAALPNQFSTVGLGSVFDLYFRQFANLVPDEVARTNFVNALLAQNGIDPNSQVVSGFLTSQATLRRNQQLSFAMFGARNSITLLANRSESQGFQTGQTAFDSFSQASKIRQQGLGLNISHRLTEMTNLSLLGSWQESIGSGTTSTKASTSVYQVNLATKLSAKTTGSLSYRRAEFDSTNPYTENAIIGAVTVIF